MIRINVKQPQLHQQKTRSFNDPIICEEISNFVETTSNSRDPETFRNYESAERAALKHEEFYRDPALH